MSEADIPRYSLDDDLEEAADRASRELPDQIARLRDRVREARRRLGGPSGGHSDGEASGA